jgi:hypothetical protein
MSEEMMNIDPAIAFMNAKSIKTPAACQPNTLYSATTSPTTARALFAMNKALSQQTRTRKSRLKQQTMTGNGRKSFFM